jgi:hypothetical protein
MWDMLVITSRGGRVYCSYTLLGVEGERAFLEPVCEELLLVGPNSLESGSGRGTPVALKLDTIRGMRITGHEAPRDGDLYSRDVERIFPAPTARRIMEGRLRTGLQQANRQRAAREGRTVPQEQPDAAQQCPSLRRGPCRPYSKRCQAHS